MPDPVPDKLTEGAGSRPCACCDGKGCPECDGTGRRYTTYLVKHGLEMRVTGATPLSDETRNALIAVAEVAVERMDLASADTSGRPRLSVAPDPAPGPVFMRGCTDCGERGDAGETCPVSEAPCGHHCNHSWSHERCCWCGKEEFVQEALDERFPDLAAALCGQYWLDERPAARGSVTLPNGREAVLEAALREIADYCNSEMVNDAGEVVRITVAPGNIANAALVAAPSRPEGTPNSSKSEQTVGDSAAEAVHPSEWPAATEDPAEDPLIEEPMDYSPIGAREPSDEEAAERVAKAFRGPEGEVTTDV